MKLIIIGGGFGGLRLARKLNNKPGFEITLIDKLNFHQFQPLFYQVATAGLDASNISFPLRKVFHHSKNISFKMAEVLQIVTAENKIITSIGDLAYDTLVIATGADTNFFGNKDLMDHALPMKTTVEALQLRYRLLQNFETATITKDETELQKRMNIVVVGGGPTGVELSGAIADMKRFVLHKDYPELDFSNMHIYLLEGTGKTLGVMSEKSSADSKKYLEKLGVTVLTNTLLKTYDGEKITLQNGDVILTYDGHEIQDSRDLTQRVGASSIGSSQRIEIMRNGQPVTDWGYEVIPQAATNRPAQGQPARRDSVWHGDGMSEAASGTPIWENFLTCVRARNRDTGSRYTETARRGCRFR